MNKDAYYFSHDSNARHDPKILALRSVYGIEGYGRYWVLIEFLREQTQYKLRKSKHLCNALAMQMQCSADEAQNFLHDCINEFELLLEDEEFIWSDSLLKRMIEKDKKSEKAKKAAKKRWEKVNNDKGSMPSESKEDANAMQAHSEGKALKESKGKEKKVKESKVNEIKEEENIENKKDQEDQKNSSCSSHSSNPFKLFESEGFGTLSELVSDSIGDLIDTYTERWVCEAMKKSVLKGKRNLGYVTGILKNWKADGIDEPWEKEEKANDSPRYQSKRYGNQKPNIPIMQYTENSDAEFTQEQLEEAKRLANEWDKPVAAGIDIDEDRPF
ncbi:Lin1244/Lin1753 domain-containing protein [Chengkuizengella axinellae]|uniref:DUF4373 domain-containing protein n=1 Tax=Chengkuizengella axinellae TaxID=3064388 RepID=A0ABT9J8F0_9BACL|nr:Lin1244/Lin1753 domain-containing protein [Chengkuizengella sp. 2205SS18-9]MDP5277199.1 DUF4373 domain-containing protein [Chengkuizengella sp. 2205SS18-9]